MKCLKTNCKEVHVEKEYQNKVDAEPSEKPGVFMNKLMNFCKQEVDYHIAAEVD